ncbi:MAG: RHS repeat protein [Elusimicrobia bacterium]|nr:RHS repeat protein [Elusimicrobiota bacterium]
MPNVFSLFPEVCPSRFAVPIPRKKSAKYKLHKTKGNTSQFTYDGQGNLTRAQDAQSHAVTIGYDSNGLPVSITDPLNHTVTITRDGNGYATQITDPLTRSAHMGYDNIGRVVSFTDGANKQTQFAYDTDDNLTQVTDAINGVTHYNYTAGIIAEGKLLSSLEDAKSHTTSFNYDTRGRLTSVTNPLNQTRSYEYDEANNLTKVTKADGVQITFEYDSLNRLIKKNIPGDSVSYAYDAAGNLITAEDNASKVQLGYDAGDRPTKVIQTNKSANLTSQLDYEYDQNGNRTKMTLAANPSPFVWNYTYDTLNRLTTIHTPENTTITLEYDALSRRTRLVYPNGTEANYTYDAASQLTGITHKKTTDNTIIAEANYAYDNAGNRTSMTDTAGQHSYGYDDLHRLTSANHPTASALDVKNEVFNYDGVGNRLNDAVRSNYTYDAANRLNEDSLYTYTYDQNGNRNGQTEKATNAHTTYIYNADNQLIGATMPDGTVATYKYDTLGNRIEKAVQPPAPLPITVTRYINDGVTTIATVDGSNNLIAQFTNGPRIDEPLTLKTGTSNYYYHADALGSVAALSNSTGETVETIEYLAYGKPVIKNHEGTIFDKSTIGNIYFYTAREFDFETGLYDNRWRHRSPDTGGFMQEDPIGFAGEDTNLYVYVRNNPVNYSDPSGLVQWGDAGRAAGGIVGNGFGIAGGVLTGGAIGWTGVGAVISGAVVVKSAYGFGANMVLMRDALFDKKPSVKGALLNELAYLTNPCDEDLQALATAGELGLDLLSLQVPKSGRALGYFIGPNGLIGLRGGGHVGKMFTSDNSLQVLTGTQAIDSYIQVRQRMRK